MLYKNFLKTQNGCPFCKSQTDEVLKENNSSYMTLSIAPYHKHHILIIPKRHFEKILDANQNENLDSLSLIKDGINILYKLGYKDFVFLVREGNGKTAGSIPHLHYHLIPDTPIGMLEGHSQRTVLSKNELDEVVKEIKSVE